MESKEATLCPLCRQEKVKIYAVGECAHPICHLCSTKMRILCEQTYCAICRQELPQVYFVSDLADTQPTIDQSRFTPIDGTGDCGIYFPIKADWIRRETEKLLRNFCPFCYSEYETFETLRDHVRRNHRYFYCDLCAEHLNLFPHERKCYTRQDLVQHIRYGDRDDTSFKGHPICRFCDDHFLDVDELYKHMRKEHYFCHLCTDDSVYYSDFDLLREHHRSNHYLCEIGQCKDVQFTNAFANEIDFRAHQVAQHGKTRAEKNQLGTIPVEFQSATRDRGQRPEPARRGTFSSGEFNTQGGNNSSKNDRDDTHREPAVAVAVPSIDEFPTLGERSSTPVNVSQQRGAWSSDGSRGIHNSADFPALASAASNASNTNASQARGIWREQQQQQQQQPTVSSSTTTSKKAPQPVKPTTNGVASINTKEDFPALKGASNAKIPAPVSMFSTWSTAKKSAKHASASANKSQPQMRMNTSRLVRDDEEEECIRRPMSDLTTSSNPIASSNISIISSSDLNDAQTNDKQNKYKNKNQSLPNSHDFPALPSTTTTQNNATSSGVWASGGTNPVAKPTTAQQKKKNNALSKKKFMEEVQALPPPPALSSTNDFPAMGLNQLGQRLITEENEPTVTTKIKEEKSPSSKKQEKAEKPLSPPSSASKTEEKPASSKKQEKAEKPLSPPSSASKTEEKPASSKKQEKAEKPLSPPSSASKTEEKPASPKKQENAENKPTVQPNKKTEKKVKTNDPIKQETSSIKDETPAKLVTNQPVTQPSVQIESAAPVPPPPPPISSTQPPPGFSTPSVVSPPPGFNPIPSSQPAPPSYIFSSSYSKRKDEFRAKLFNLFDGDMTLFVEYDKFCEAFYQTKISSKDFIKYTTDLFKDKLDEYLIELIVIIPNIEQQNELYGIWKKDIHTTPSSSSQTANNWTKKNIDEKEIHICHLCRQIMFESETDEHNSYHPEFNTQFPSLPASALPLGRGSGRKKK